MTSLESKVSQVLVTPSQVYLLLHLGGKSAHQDGDGKGEARVVASL